MSYGNDLYPGGLIGKDEAVTVFTYGKHRADALILAAVNRLNEKADQIMSALTDLQAADQALKDEVTKFLTDIAGRLGTVDDASAEQVVTDINAEVAALQAADPASTPPAG